MQRDQPMHIVEAMRLRVAGMCQEQPSDVLKCTSHDLCKDTAVDVTTCFTHASLTTKQSTLQAPKRDKKWARNIASTMSVSTQSATAIRLGAFCMLLYTTLMHVLCLPYLYVLPSIAILIALTALPGAQVALHTVAALPVGHDLAQRGRGLCILAGTALEDGRCGVLRTGVWRGRVDAALCIRLPHTVLH